jgi:hypothetical protein
MYGLYQIYECTVYRLSGIKLYRLYDCTVCSLPNSTVNTGCLNVRCTVSIIVRCVQAVSTV